MIAILIGIALKSLIVAGFALGLLAVLKKHSAAERSWVAHIGLLALIVLAFAPLALPRWSVEIPALPAQAPEPAAAAPTLTTRATMTSGATVLPPPSTASIRIAPAAIATAAYALPAALLLIITLIALFRLVALRARAEVLVDGHWLSALARAQRRMGFKHGTALLTSNDLSSPISWGLLRPVILLNARAVEAAGEAEAIIAHELAHVARMDWIKLLLARVATALFWFNPLVWMLAREAHQLREEAADDSVLAADIPDTDYAQLLVGVARHECPGLLLGAHGVAPSKSSLARRVARVLDGKSVRGPVARSFAWGVFAGAVLVAAPLAALTLTPAGAGKPRQFATRPALPIARAAPIAPYYEVLADAPPADLGSIIADGVSTAVAAVAPANRERLRQQRTAALAETRASADDARRVAIATAGTARAAVRFGHPADDRQIDRTIEMHVLGVTPDYARGLAAAGLRNLDKDDLISARAVGLTADYARSLAAAGVPPEIEDYIQLRAVGVPAQYVTSLRTAGYHVTDADRLVEMWAVGIGLSGPRAPPPSPRRARPPDADPDGG